MKSSKGSFMSISPLASTVTPAEPFRLPSLAATADSDGVSSEDDPLEPFEPFESTQPDGRAYAPEGPDTLGGVVLSSVDPYADPYAETCDVRSARERARADAAYEARLADLRAAQAKLDALSAAVRVVVEKEFGSVEKVLVMPAKSSMWRRLVDAMLAAEEK